MANLFRGRDRRALEKMSALMGYIESRDIKARDPKKTRAIYTRTEVVDSFLPILGYAWGVLKTRFAELLGAEMETDIALQAMSSAKGEVLVIGAESFIAELSGADLKPTTSVGVNRVDDSGVVWNFHTSLVAPFGSNISLRYTWEEVADDRKSFRVKAGEMWLDSEIAVIFLPAP